MAAMKEIRALQKLVLEDFKVLAALELADIYNVRTLRELLVVVCPNSLPSPEVFDCVADAFSLRQVRDIGKRPAPALRLK